MDDLDDRIEDARRYEALITKVRDQEAEINKLNARINHVLRCTNMARDGIIRRLSEAGYEPARRIVESSWPKPR